MVWVEATKMKGFRKMKQMWTRLAYSLRSHKQKWRVSQEEYIEWTKQTLPRDYIRTIQRLGRKFKRFIGASGFCLDVGCGNGVIGGRTYREIGYQYLSDNSSVGVDPLPLEKEKPVWLKEYARALCEHLPFKDETFDTVVLATTLDHVGDIPQCLRECGRVLKAEGSIKIWLTCLHKNQLDRAHPTRLTREDLNLLIRENGWRVAKTVSEWFSVYGDTVFLKAVKT